MTQNQLEDFFLKLGHDLSGQRRCLDLIKLLLHERAIGADFEDAKRLLAATISQFDLTQREISSVQDKFLKESKPEKGISQL